MDESYVSSSTENERKSLELLYNDVYSTLETISVMINDETTPFLEREEHYIKCNVIIEEILIEEKYTSLRESLEQLQYSLSGQLILLRPTRNSENETHISSESSISSETESLDSASGLTSPSVCSGVNSLESKKEDAVRLKSISDTKKTPTCEGLHQVAGLEEAKQLLQEALILPTKYPQLFKGRCQPWSSILLYGPPGTGKTRLAHAVAAEINADFYCISAADLLSSWVGESEKMIRETFRVQPGSKSKKIIIFIDEIDSLCRRRSSSEAEHARRLKTELLIQMEGASKKNIFLLCATNCPWEIDPAFLRRFQRRIYISTPNREARLEILKLHSGLQETSIDWNTLLEKTEGYSGSDLSTLTQYALLQPVREVQHATTWRYRNDGMIVPCDEDNHPNAMKCTLKDLPPTKVGARHVDISDFVKAIACTSSTISKDDLQLYEKFTKQYGQYS